MTFNEKLNEIHQRSIENQKEFVNVVAAIRSKHPNVEDEMYHLRDRLYKQFTRDLEFFKRLAKYLEENRIPIETEFDPDLFI